MNTRQTGGVTDDASASESPLKTGSHASLATRCAAAFQRKAQTRGDKRMGAVLRSGILPTVPDMAFTIRRHRR